MQFSELPFDVQSFFSRLYTSISNFEFIGAYSVVNFFYRRTLSTVVPDFDWTKTVVNSAFHFIDMPDALSEVQPTGNEVNTRFLMKDHLVAVGKLWQRMSCDENVARRIRKVCG